MSTNRPAEPERKNPHVGESNPAASLWDEEKPYTGPPEDGQPRKGSAVKDPALISKIAGDTPRRK